MRRITLFLLSAALATGNLTAQSSLNINGKDKMTFEKKFSDQTTNKASSDYKQEKLKVVNFDGQINSSGKETIAEKSERKHIVSVETRKSSRDDVATIIFEVGIPFYFSSFPEVGLNMILDSKAELFDYIWDYFGEQNWDAMYEMCDYKIPENASSDLNNPVYLLDDYAILEIPEGIYDFAFLVPFPLDNCFYNCCLYGPGDDMWKDYCQVFYGDDYEFKAGYEYYFYANRGNYLIFYPDLNVKMSKIILPPVSEELTSQEEIKVVIQNRGNLNIEDNFELTYRINDGDWIEPEIITETLMAGNEDEIGEEVIYTFNTKADFSEVGVYKVEAKVVYNMDMWEYDNNSVGHTKNPLHKTLPFIDNFDTEESIFENWKILDLKPEREYHSTWTYVEWDDADDQNGCLTISPSYYEGIVSNDYLITDPIIIPEAGRYNISCWVKTGFDNTEKFRIMYGTSSNPDDMIGLDDYPTLETNDEWIIIINNFDIETPDNYFFAFHYYSDALEGAGLFSFDKVKISEGQFVGVPDIIYKNILSPKQSCSMTDVGEIGAVMYNRGSEPLSEFSLSYQVNNQPIVNQTFTETIGIRESVTVYFTQTVDFSSVGEYIIKFNSSTPNEEVTSNNEAEITLINFSPITELPFISDFINETDRADWWSYEKDGWNCYDWNDEYYYTPTWDNSNIPLISRCVTLEPDIYRFTLVIEAPMYWGGTNDFYIAMGKSGTDPYEWQPVKEYKYYSNNEIKEEYFTVEITDDEEYAFAFFPVMIETDIYIYKFAIEFFPEYDFAVRKFEHYQFPRLTPAYQLEGENIFAITLQNKGLSEANGTIKMSLNNNEITSKDFTLSYEETKNIELKPVFDLFPAGQMNLTFYASIQGGINIDWELLFNVSDSTFVGDYIDFFSDEGIGFDEPAGMGMVFDLQKEDILTSITIGFLEDEFSANENIELAVYEVYDDYGYFTLTEMCFEKQYKRSLGSNTGTTFSVPDLKLQPGKYFFEVRQLNSVNLGVAYDGEPDGVAYLHNPEWGWFGQNNQVGNIHVRPNFGKNCVGIEELRTKNYELRIYPNPVRGELRIDSSTTLTNLNEEFKMEKITIYNAAGQVVLIVADINSVSYSVNTERFSSGLYFISVQTKSGIVNSKFVVK